MKIILIIVSLLYLPQSAFADWVLDNNASSLNFISTKKSTVSEVHYFNSLDGRINSIGELRIVIDLSSVKTGIEIRNQRLQSLLFEVGKFPNAIVISKINMDEVHNMQVGDSFHKTYEFNLKLHGLEQSFSAGARVTKLNNGHLFVVPDTPIILNAAKFNLVPGINALTKVAKLPSISTAIPITFMLEFEVKK